MKTKILHIVVICLLLFSCDKDESTIATKQIGEIKVEFSKERFLAISGNQLKIEPEEIFVVGDDNPDLSFEWKIGDTETDAVLVSQSRIFDQVMNYPVGKYHLYFIVTDNKTTRKYYQLLYVDVESQYFIGLMIAHTEDEMTTDLNEVQSSCTNEDYTGEDKIYRNILSSLYGSAIQGVAVDIALYKDLSSAEDSKVVIATPNSVIRYDGNMDFIDRDDDVFLIRPDEIKPKFILGGSSMWVLKNGDKLYGYYNSVFTESDNNFLGPIEKLDYSDYQINHLTYDNLHRRIRIGTFAYDEVTNSFLRYSFPYSGVNALFEIKQGRNSTYNFSNVGAFDCKYLWNFGSYNQVLGVLKSENSNDHYAYAFSFGGSPDYVAGNQRIIDLNGCENISKVTMFCTLISEEVLYYVVDNKIYAANLAGGNTPTSNLVYTPEVGDEITSIQCLHQQHMTIEMKITNVNDPNGDPIDIDVANRALTLTTYNQANKEGKVIMIPVYILNSSNGLEPNRALHKTWGGFGRILDVALDKNNSFN